jgi:hypothetical protein
MSAVPHLRAPLPFIGHALSFNRDPVRLLSEGHRRFGEIFSFTLFGKQVFASCIRRCATSGCSATPR